MNGVGIVKIAEIVKIVNSAAICKMLNTVMIIFNTQKKNIMIKLDQRKLYRSRINDLLEFLFFVIYNM